MVRASGVTVLGPVLGEAARGTRSVCSNACGTPEPITEVPRLEEFCNQARSFKNLTVPNGVKGRAQRLK